MSVIGPGKAQKGLQSHRIDETLGGILRILCRDKQNARHPVYCLDGVYIAEIQGMLGVVVPLKSPVGSGDYVRHFAYQNSPKIQVRRVEALGSFPDGLSSNSGAVLWLFGGWPKPSHVRRLLSRGIG